MKLTPCQRLIERQIQKAQSAGQFDALEGEGKPLPGRPAQTFADAAETTGFRAMAQAGVLPREIEIKKEMDALRRSLGTLAGDEQRKAVMAEIADLDLRYNIAREARQMFMRK